MNQTEIEVALAEHGKEIGSLKHRVDDMERIADAVHSLAGQMAAQTAEIHHLSENVGKGNRQSRQRAGKTWWAPRSGLWPGRLRP